MLNRIGLIFIFLFLFGTNMGCVSSLERRATQTFSQYRGEQQERRRLEESRNPSQFGDLWKQGYGFGNPNPERARQGLEPLNFDGSTGSKKKGYFTTLTYDYISFAAEKVGSSTLLKAAEVSRRIKDKVLNR